MPPFYFIGISISIAYFFQKTHKIKPERSVWIGCDFLGKEKGKKEKREKKENHSRRTRERQTGGTALCLLCGMGIAFAITCIIFIGFGMILTYTAASEESLPLVSLICTALSAAAAGYDWAACKRKRGLLWGGSGRACLHRSALRYYKPCGGFLRFACFGADDACSGTCGRSHRRNSGGKPQVVQQN